MLNIGLITSLSIATVVIGSQIPAQALNVNASNGANFDSLNVELETSKTTRLGHGQSLLEYQEWGQTSGIGGGGGGGGSGGGSGGSGGGSGGGSTGGGTGR